MRDTLNGTSGNDVLYTSETDRRVVGHGGDDLIDASVHGGGIYGSAGNDTLIGGGIGFQQTHMYGGTGNDDLHMGTSDLLAPFGDHAFGGQDFDRFLFNTGDGEDSERITGRIDDFDVSRDEIWVNDKKVDFSNLPENVRIVQYHTQPWILIEDRILYALEGARQFADIDHNHNSDHEDGILIDIGNDDQEERHFVEWPVGWKDGVPASADIPYADFMSYFPHAEIDPDKLAGLKKINGTSGPDSLSGGAKGEFIHGGDKPDTIHGKGGDDVIEGGEWSDIIYGGDGDDSISGGLDNDLIHAEAGDDIVYGGSGEDTIYGGEGDDKLSGNSGQDLIYGGTGKDTLSGGWGDDTLYGGEGDDVLYAALGPDDVILPQGGKSHLFGGNGDDILYAAPEGAATLEGGGGKDTLIAAENADITVKDFNPEEDVFDFNGLSPGSEALDAHLVHRIGPNGNEMVLQLGGNTTVAFSGYGESDRADLLNALRSHPSVSDVDPDKHQDPIYPSDGNSEPKPPLLGSAPPPVQQPPQNAAAEGGGCFVATACYGDMMHPDVAWLRLFRNKVLRKYWAGRVFIRVYHALGPYMARFVGHDRQSGAMMRAFLSRLVAKGQKHWPNLKW